MPHQKWPPSLSRFIQCGSLPGGRRRKTLAAHVTTERMWVVTWAPGFDRGGGGIYNGDGATLNLTTKSRHRRRTSFAFCTSNYWSAFTLVLRRNGMLKTRRDQFLSGPNQSLPRPGELRISHGSAQYATIGAME